MVNSRIISSFEGDYRFFSNFYPCKVNFEGTTYPSVENAYQAAKSLTRYTRVDFINLSPGQAKRLGKNTIIRPDWENVKFTIMEDLIRQKFSKDPFNLILLNTGDMELVEGNRWHDNTWGSCNCEKCGFQGMNMLGKTLMKIRDELKEKLNAGI